MNPIAIVFIVLVVLLLVLLITCVRIVRQSTAQVIERLGKYSRTLETGIHFFQTTNYAITLIKSISDTLYR